MDLALEILTAEWFQTIIVMIAGAIFTKLKVDESTQKQIADAAKIGMEYAEQLKSIKPDLPNTAVKEVAIEKAMETLPKFSKLIGNKKTKKRVDVAIEAAIGAIKLGKKIRASS